MFEGTFRIRQDLKVSSAAEFAIRSGRTAKPSRSRENLRIRLATARLAFYLPRCRSNGKCKFCPWIGSERRKTSGTNSMALRDAGNSSAFRLSVCATWVPDTGRNSRSQSRLTALAAIGTWGAAIWK